MRYKRRYGGNKLVKKILIVKLSLIFIFSLMVLYSSTFVLKNIYYGDNLKISGGDELELQTVGKNSEFTVCIDPGHGGNDDGTSSGNGILEQDVVLDVSLKLGEILENEGINVVYTRTSKESSLPIDIKKNLKERVKISKEANADLFVSIHCNAGESPEYKGIETWCRFPNTEGARFAKSIQEELLKLNYSIDREVRYESEKSLAVLRSNNATSALVELGFLTNSSDAKFITSKHGQAKCAQAISKAILKFKPSRKN